MDKTYTINITDGSGTEQVLNGTYEVTANTNGYDNTTIDPTSIVVDPVTNTFQFTIEAAGTLTLHITEEGTVDGTPVVGATFIRCDASGNTYGTAITTDTNGNAVFENVPFAETDSPLVYYKQTASDGDHEFSADLANTGLTESTKQVEVQNAQPASRTFTFTDANYANLPIGSGTITLQN